MVLIVWFAYYHRNCSTAISKVTVESAQNESYQSLKLTAHAQQLSTGHAQEIKAKFTFESDKTFDYRKFRFLWNKSSTSCKVCEYDLDTFLNRTPIFDQCVVRWWLKRLSMGIWCLKEVGFLLQILLTTPCSIVATIEKTYVHRKGINKHALSLNKTKSRKVWLSIHLMLMFCCRFAIVTQVVLCKCNCLKLQNMKNEPFNITYMNTCHISYNTHNHQGWRACVKSCSPRLWNLSSDSKTSKRNGACKNWRHNVKVLKTLPHV